MADWVKTCHFLCLSWVSQISYNCTVTHHHDTHHVRETGLMIQIPLQSMGDRAWIIWCFLEKRHFLCYFCRDGRLAWQKCRGSYLCRDIYLCHPVCGASWHQLIISSELRREQSSCVSMSRTSIYLLIQVIDYNCHYFFIQSFSFSLSLCLLSFRSLMLKGFSLRSFVRVVSPPATQELDDLTLMPLCVKPQITIGCICQCITVRTSVKIAL